MSDDPKDDSDHEGYGDVDAPGWKSIDLTVAAVYGSQTPHQYTSTRPYDLQSPAPLPAVTAWEAPSPRAWHYVSYGLSELFEKSSEDAEVSGFGYELTMLVAAGDEEEPPVWPVKLIQALGSHCLRTRTGFDTGHCIDLDGPLGPGLDTKLCAVALVPDARLGKIETMFGTVLFLRLLGLTKDELEVVAELDLGDKIACLAELSPLAQTEPGREDWSQDPEKLKVLRRFRVGLKL